MPIPTTMTAVLLTGHGGPEVLEYRTDVAVPTPGPTQVLINVLAAGVNNTDINTRTGWYAKSVTTGTTTDGGVDGEAGSWSGEPLRFPRIQGADICGRVVAVGESIDPGRIGERVIVATMQQAPSGEPFACVTLGSELDGGFAQFAVIESGEAHAIETDWTDEEVASVPCASSTAENMLDRASVAAGDRVLVTGASGGVGVAAVQLAKRRGAHVTAVSGAAKADAVRAIGADAVVARGADLVDALGHESVDVVVDLVAGPAWPALLDVLVRGGRYVCSGAIAGPIVELDVRTLYLKDLTLVGSTYQPPDVLNRLVGYIERDEIRPLVAATYPLGEIAAAQEAFLAKQFVGKLVLVPPPLA
ncbi:MAG: zinc-binding dehydrogenase [Ilumatobacter sp.]|nr:zinc-binding dehydrogenase [Ilumatobacter sp.]